MPRRPEGLKPQDVAVALRLALGPEAAYDEIAADLSMSASTAHASVRRLQRAGLLRPESRSVNRHALLEFLEHGLRYVFPATPDAMARGVPTAYSGPLLASEIVAEDAVVWADPDGRARGHAIPPLVEKAATLPTKCPAVYDLLTLVDAIRIGRVRERSRAMALLKEHLTVAA